MTNQEYHGGELELFARAVRWKAYMGAQIAPHLGSRVLEVGAGIGGTTPFIATGECEKWICLEPDASQVEQIRQQCTRGHLPRYCEARLGSVAALGPDEKFDAILYIDVLEHIEDDRTELSLASKHLAPAGRLVVLGPAHQALYTSFDRAIGHYRRYTARSLAAVAPSELEVVRLAYLDSVGLLASAANRLLLRREMPKVSEVLTWDRLMVPVSRVLDPGLGHRLGKSVLGVWRRK